MGSRIMHAIIAQKVADALNIQDKTSFILGGIAADATSNKVASHFYIGELTNFTRAIDYEGFYQKYKTMDVSDYIQGYYTHLIADDLWLQGLYVPWLKNRMATNPAVLNAYHQDFKLLNGKLIEHYACKEELQILIQATTKIHKLEEVKTQDVVQFIPFVLEDMNYEQNIVNEQLSVFTFEQIIGYIETSVEKSIVLIKQKRDVLSFAGGSHENL